MPTTSAAPVKALGLVPVLVGAIVAVWHTVVVETTQLPIMSPPSVVPLAIIMSEVAVMLGSPVTLESIVMSPPAAGMSVCVEIMLIVEVTAASEAGVMSAAGAGAASASMLTPLLAQVVR